MLFLFFSLSSSKASLLMFEDLDLWGMSLCTYRCSSNSLFSFPLSIITVSTQCTGLLSRSPICRLASGLRDRDIRQGATSKMDKMLSSRHTKHTRRVHPVFFYLPCFDNILFAE